MHFLGMIARAGWEIRENVEGRVVGVSLPALVTASGLSEPGGRTGGRSPPPKILKDQLTYLNQGGKFSSPSTTSPPPQNFQTLCRPCTYLPISA